MVVVQGTIHRRLQIGRDGHLDQSEAYDISEHVREYATSSAWFPSTSQSIISRMKMK